MFFVAIVSFAVGMWLTFNKVEYLAMRARSPDFLDYVVVAAWTTFAWSMGLFPS